MPPSGRIQVPQQMNQHQRAFAFQQVSANLFAVATFITRQVENIVLYSNAYEGRAAKRLKRSRSDRSFVAMSAPIRQGWIKKAPVRFFENHPQVVVGDVAAVVPHPAKLHRLPFKPPSLSCGRTRRTPAKPAVGPTPAGCLEVFGH